MTLCIVGVGMENTTTGRQAEVSKSNDTKDSSFELNCNSASDALQLVAEKQNVDGALWQTYFTERCFQARRHALMAFVVKAQSK